MSYLCGFNNRIIIINIMTTKRSDFCKPHLFESSIGGQFEIDVFQCFITNLIYKIVSLGQMQNNLLVQYIVKVAILLLLWEIDHFLDFQLRIEILMLFDKCLFFV